MQDSVIAKLKPENTFFVLKIDRTINCTGKHRKIDGLSINMWIYFQLHLQSILTWECSYPCISNKIHTCTACNSCDCTLGSFQFEHGILDTSWCWPKSSWQFHSHWNTSLTIHSTIIIFWCNINFNYISICVMGIEKLGNVVNLL